MCILNKSLIVSVPLNFSLKKATTNTTFLVLNILISSRTISLNIYDKRDDFYINIVNSNMTN